MAICNFLSAPYLFLLALVVTTAKGQQCSGYAHSCSSIYASKGCTKSGIVDTCDTSDSICSYSCEDQEGCRCSLSNFNCETIAYTVSCDGNVVCTGVPNSCSSMETQSDCEGHSGCYWIPDTEELTFEEDEEVGICQGSAASCSSLYSPTSCFKTSTVDTCDFTASCEVSCEDQGGCSCTVSNFDCDSSLYGGVTCDGSIACQGQARSCSRLETKVECENQLGCEWFPLERNTPPPTSQPPILTPTSPPPIATPTAPGPTPTTDNDAIGSTPTIDNDTTPETAPTPDNDAVPKPPSTEDTETAPGPDQSPINEPTSVAFAHFFHYSCYLVFAVCSAFLLNQ